MNERVDRAIHRLRRELRGRYGVAVRELRLFGSQPRGDAAAESDVDVLVVLDQVEWRTRCEVIDLAADIGLAEDLCLSPTIMDTATWRRWCDQQRPLAMEIARDGVPL